MKTKRLVYGVGINDADYETQKFEYLGKANGQTVNKSLWKCPFYRTWSNMLERCYSQRFQSTRPSYVGCTVCEEWERFSNFKAWMETQEWEGLNLDKDILFRGNKVYSPETCVFISKRLNSFITEPNVGSLPIGVTWDEGRKKYRAQISNPFTGKNQSLGDYEDSIAAHKVWLVKKLEFARVLASEQLNTRVAAALVERYIMYERQHGFPQTQP